jgi:hypothetical protein
MAALPILVFPRREASERSDRTARAPKIQYPSAERQGARLTPQIQSVEAAFAAQRAQLRAEVAGIEPEKVLVLETVGDIKDFMNAVRLIPGMEWMAEVEEESITPDEDFFDQKKRDKPIGGRLFLVFTSQTALIELLRLWNAFQLNPDAKFAYRFGRWRSLFRQLRTIRVWNVEDRLRETGLLEAWQDDLRHGEQLMRFEAELWFRQNPVLRDRAIRELRVLVEEQRGTVTSEAVIPEIAYHAAIGQIPARAAQVVIGQAANIRLLKCEQVMFFRPVGQFSAPSAIDEPGPAIAPVVAIPAGGDPVVALLDGLPIENHALLAGRLVVDDPDNWGADYPAGERQHGTAMASLIVHGDVGKERAPIDTRIYVRPVMRPDPRDWQEPRFESIPRDAIPADLIHRAVRRMFEIRGEDNPAAPSIRVINMSIGDRARPFDRIVSPFARIIDWLSSHYRVLFIISVGNQLTELGLNLTGDELAALDSDERQKQVFRALAMTAHVRRLLSPAESINALSIGSLHDDESRDAIEPHRINPYDASGFPSPLNAVGSGFRRSVKPELLCEGGRQLYSVRPNQENGRVTLLPETLQRRPPGQRAASPGVAGDVTRTRYTRGTSNAAAIATRNAVAISEMLDGIAPAIDATFAPVVIKCLLTHSSAWTGGADLLKNVIKQMNPDSNLREQVSRFLGYGKIDVERVLACTASRITIIGFGDIGDDEGHTYLVPLPPTLSGIVGRRRLTVTLAWFSPINPLHRSYRRAGLWFETSESSDVLRLDRLECDFRAVQRGTVQHEIFEGERAIAFIDGTNIHIKINCREDAGPLLERVPYSVAVTFEVAEELAVPVYEEIRIRLNIPVPIRPV